MRHLEIRGLAVVIGAVLSIAATTCYSAEKKVAQWSYGGADGPAKWGLLDKAYEDCKFGELQSPIDIPDAAARKGDLPSLLFDYKAAPLKIIDNGHTIQVNYAPGSHVMVAGKKYELVQFQFHRPSEEKINGKGHDMAAHLLHKGPDGKHAVIAILLDTGAESRLIKTLWDNLPKDKGKENVVDAVTINAMDLLPKNKGYYTFSGSLTAPPCTEDVTWFILKTPVTVSADQIARFARYYPMNARPVQPVYGRDIQATR